MAHFKHVSYWISTFFFCPKRQKSKTNFGISLKQNKNCVYIVFLIIALKQTCQRVCFKRSMQIYWCFCSDRYVITPDNSFTIKAVDQSYTGKQKGVTGFQTKCLERSVGADPLHPSAGLVLYDISNYHCKNEQRRSLILVFRTLEFVSHLAGFWWRTTELKKRRLWDQTPLSGQMNALTVLSGFSSDQRTSRRRIVRCINFFVGVQTYMSQKK